MVTQQGLSLTEVLVSCIFISGAILGLFKLQWQAQHWLQEYDRQSRVQTQRDNMRELQSIS